MKKYEHLHQLLCEWRDAIVLLKPVGALSEIIDFMEANQPSVNDALNQSQMPACAHDWMYAAKGRACAICRVYEVYSAPPLEPAIIGACVGPQGPNEQVSTTATVDGS
jgi:hypothetical protein